jgi:hypothetical protein
MEFSGYLLFFFMFNGFDQLEMGASPSPKRLQSDFRGLWSSHHWSIGKATELGEKPPRYLLWQTKTEI